MAFHMLFYSLVAYVRQQCNVSCSLNCRGQFTLVICTSTGYPSRQDLCTICHALLQLCDILVVDLLNVFGREAAELLALEKRILLVGTARLTLTLSTKSHD